MEVINLLTNKKYEVHKYKNVLYLKMPQGDYYILEECDYTEEDIETGKEYSHYKSEYKLYSGFYSNQYESFANEQIDIWELI